MFSNFSLTFLTEMNWYKITEIRNHFQRTPSIQTLSLLEELELVIFKNYLLRICAMLLWWFSGEKPPKITTVAWMNQSLFFTGLTYSASIIFPQNFSTNDQPLFLNWLPKLIIRISENRGEYWQVSLCNFSGSHFVYLTELVSFCLSSGYISRYLDKS